MAGALRNLNQSQYWQRLRQIRRDEQGQDLIEYALLAGFMVVAVYVILPADLMPAVSGIFSRLVGVASTLTNH